MCGIFACLGCPGCHNAVRNQLISSLCRRGPDHTGDDTILLGNGSELYLLGTLLHMRGSKTLQPYFGGAEERKNVLLWNGNAFGGEIQICEGENDTAKVYESLNSADGAKSVLSTLSKVHGPWAFAYWQEETQSLWFGRDVFGRRSLLWHLPGTDDDDSFFLASIGSYNQRDMPPEFWKEVPALCIYQLLCHSNSSMELVCYPWMQKGDRFQNVASLLDDVKLSNCRLKVAVCENVNLQVPFPALNLTLPPIERQERATQEGEETAKSFAQPPPVATSQTRENSIAKQFLAVLLEAVSIRVKNASPLPSCLSHAFSCSCTKTTSAPSCGDICSRLSISCVSSESSAPSCGDICSNLSISRASLGSDTKTSGAPSCCDICSRLSVSRVFSDSDAKTSSSPSCGDDCSQLSVSLVSSDSDARRSSGPSCDDICTRLSVSRASSGKTSGIPSCGDICQHLSVSSHIDTKTSGIPDCGNACSSLSISRASSDSGSACSDLPGRPDICSCIPAQPETCTSLVYGRAKIGLLFSGGVDSVVLAALVDRCLPLSEEVDLINVAFEEKQNKKSHFFVPDRVSAIESLKELNRGRKWNLIQVNVTAEEVNALRVQYVSKLIYPLCTVLDDSIGCALWFAARGRGTLYGQPEDVHYICQARTLLIGIGADEQLGGYSRHRTKFRSNGWKGLLQEMDMDIKRLAQRNLGRDDRCIADHHRDGQFPFLDETVVSFLQKLPVWEKVDLNLPRGKGEKYLLREVASLLGCGAAAQLPKRAIQFGSRIAKLSGSSGGRESGSDKCSRLVTAGSQD